MNRRNFLKIGMCLFLGLSIFGGCAAPQEQKYTIEELDNLAEIRIYSADDNELIKTVSDEEQLYQYNQCTTFENLYTEDHQNELEKDLEDATEQYYLVSYKYPVAILGEKELEKNTTITIYEDINMIKMEVSAENINSFISEEFLVFYYEISDEEMQFYLSLIE